MLDHEIVFKKQVQELHRLYAVQKKMMNSDLKHATFDFLPRNSTFPERHLVGPTRFVLDDSFLQEDEDLCSRFQERPLDLVGLSSCNSSEEVDLSLSIGMSSNKRSRISENNWKNKIISQDIIDLEESQGTRLSGNQYSHQDHLKIDPCLRKRETWMNDVIHHQWSSFNQGSDVKKTKIMDLDLNKDQQDDTFFHSLGPYPSSESCNRIGKPIKVSSTSKQPKVQTSEKETDPYFIDLESSNLTEEEKVSEIGEQKDKEDSAALALISISMQQTWIKNQETTLVSNETEIIQEIKKRVIPQSSIDSYESLVLKQEESSIDEDSATSKAFEMEEFGEKKNGIKLKRGRRMKDFQKDILPTLSSLTKDEIWEDISVLESVIRSREYKRLQKGKTGNSVKSKRAKGSYVGRRCCLQKKKASADEKMECV